MGITGFYSFFESAATTKYISELRGSIVVVDLSGVLIRFGIGIRNQGNDKKNKDGRVINHLYALVKYTRTLLEKGIFPFYVFDGKISRNKISTAERKQNKIISHAKCESITDKTSPEFIKHFKRGYSFSRSDIEECKQLLEFMGIPYIHAPGEADSQCAAIAHKFSHLISGVVTDDSDILIYGCPKTYKDFNPRTSTMTEYNYLSVIDIFHKKINEILRNIGKPLIKYDHTFLKNTLRQFCILMGSDYGKLITIKNNLNKNYILLKLFVQCNFDVMCLINKIKTDNTYSGKYTFHVNEDIVENFNRADSEYTDSSVIVPDESMITINYPKSDMLANFLSETMNYDSKEIATLIGVITNNYYIFREMRELRRNNGGSLTDNTFGSFSTYQYRYCKKNINNGSKYNGIKNEPCQTNNRWQHNTRDNVCAIRAYG